MTDPDWRSQHCADLAADWLKEATGRDVWGELGGPPRSPKEAAAIYRKLRVRKLKNAVSKVLGKPIDPKFAMRGDIAMVDNALGVVRGDMIECFDRMQPIERAECVWRSHAGKYRWDSVLPRHRAVDGINSDTAAGSEIVDVNHPENVTLGTGTR